MKNNREFKAEQKFLLMSPRKIRPVIAVIKKMKPAEAVARLPFVQRRAGEAVAKVIKAALASAKLAGISETDLVFSEIRVGEGPRLKRGIAVSRGQWHPIKKRMSHIRIILRTQNKPVTQSANKQSLASQGPGKQINPKLENEKIEKKGAKKSVAKS